MNILVTAGPTYEYLDAVRFLGNRSTGKMGFAVAQAALRAGHRVTLVSGPTDLEPPLGVRFIRVTSAREMFRAVLKVYPRMDALVMTAAVSDYRPARRIQGKMKKTPHPTTLMLTPNPDILATLAQRKKTRLHIGFALEAQNGTANALKKLREKKLDYVVLNSPAALGAERVDVTLFHRDGQRHPWHAISKTVLAQRLVKILEREFERR